MYSSLKQSFLFYPAWLFELIKREGTLQEHSTISGWVVWGRAGMDHMLGVRVVAIGIFVLKLLTFWLV